MEQKRFAKSQWRAYIMAGIFFAGGAMAMAAEGVQSDVAYALDTVVVTATRTPIDEFKANASIFVVTKEMIEKNHYTNVHDALRDVPGVTVPSYGLSGEAYSANGLMLNGTADIVVLVDGVRANINGSAGTFGKMATSELSNMTSIERIEILKSSSSTLYGADAAGGVINIITKKPLDGETKTNLSILKGSFDKEQYNLNHRGNKDGFYWGISLQKKNTGHFKDGWGREIVEEVHSVNNVYTIGKRIDKYSDISLVYQTYKTDYLRPTGGWSEMVKDKQFNQFNSGRKNNTKLTFNYHQKINKKIENTFSAFNYKHRQDELSWQGKHKPGAFTVPAIYHYSSIGVSDQFTYRPNDKHTVVGGGDWYRDKTDKYVSSGKSFNDKAITTAAIYLNDTYSINDTWEVSYGLRFNHNSLFGNSWIPSVVLGNSPNECLNYFVGYKKFFIAPYMSQLYSPRYGDPSLKASTGIAFEAGVNYKFTDKTIGMIKFFNRSTKDSFGYDPEKINPISKEKGSYANYGDEKARGFDIQFKTSFAKYWKASASYTYTYLETIPLAGKVTHNIRVPRSAWNIGIDYEKSKFTGGIHARAVIGKEGADRPSNKTSAAEPFHTYWVVDGMINYRPNGEINIFAKCSNIFDRLYTDQSYELNPEQSWYSAPGRIFEVGMEYTF